MRVLRCAGFFVSAAVVVACSTTTSGTANNPGQTTPAATSAAATTSAPTTAAPATSAAGGGLTLEAYNKVTTGMTEAQVTAITGPCETTSETSIAGSTTKTLECKGAEPLSSAILIFVDGKLSSKSQVGLSGTSGEVKGSMTLAKFNQLQTGQTQAEVEAITGPCEKSSETNIAGQTGFTLTCYASDGLGNALLLFSDGKLASKSQSGLQ